MSPEGGERRAPLSTWTKLVLGSGDHALTLTLSSLSLVYVAFLIDQIGLRPALASAVPLVGRFVDAFTDPLMGRISDATQSSAGRRRPYFLFGALPFALSFALLWVDPGLESTGSTFAFCVGTYVFYSLASTVVSVPYVALMAEIAPGYDERNSLNAWRSVLTLAGTLIAGAGLIPLTRWLGSDGAPAYLLTGTLLGIWIAIPWLLIYALVREPAGFQRRPATSLLEGLRLVLRHRNYLHLAGLYVCGRIAMDLASMILVLYFASWLGRESDFAPAMALFIVAAALSLPLWLRLGARLDKRRVFQIGCIWWGLWMLVLFTVTPDAPSRSVTFALIALAAVGYGVIDMMPWSMLADVVDEDELNTGERREGLYGGLLTWIRKLGGALGVLVGGVLLDVAGYLPGGGEQPESARQMIRAITALGPTLFLAGALWVSQGYTLSRHSHASILLRLGRRTGGN